MEILVFNLKFKSEEATTLNMLNLQSVFSMQFPVYSVKNFNFILHSFFPLN